MYVHILNVSWKYTFRNCLGRKGQSMYFLEHGAAEVRLPDGTIRKTLYDGDHFGGKHEISIVMGAVKL